MTSRHVAVRLVKETGELKHVIVLGAICRFVVFDVGAARSGLCAAYC